MRVLLYIEPVTFWDAPEATVGQLGWARLIEKSILNAHAVLAVCCNEDLLPLWLHDSNGPPTPRIGYAIDRIAALAPFGFQMRRYREAIYAERDTTDPLYRRLRQVRAHFRPDLIVATWHNAIARAAFAGVPMLHIEQPPLPRIGHPQRIMFDPVGASALSTLAVHGERIRNATIDAGTVEQIALAVQELRAYLATDARQHAAQRELTALADGQKVALLATQPPDAFPCANGYDAFDIVSLICAWEQELPPGWIGVPTFHFGYQLPRPIQLYLQRHLKRLRILSEEHSRDTTEALLCVADGLVTVSSSTATTGLLFGRRVVSVGLGAMREWGGATVAGIEQAPVLSDQQIAATLAFLTHRYAHTRDALEADPGIFAGLAEATMATPDPAEWFLDLADWTPDRARDVLWGRAAEIG